MVSLSLASCACLRFYLKTFSVLQSQFEARGRGTKKKDERIEGSTEGRPEDKTAVGQQTSKGQKHDTVGGINGFWATSYNMPS
mmetsp:Transcript_8280/g.13978  ORF Transcript_8280/g.13978 Transcript_8280/m.13978 type:complete len:83 (-) Transcript_8280:22-270(-)